MEPTRTHGPPPSLGLWDAASLVVGIVVGTSIFRASTQVFQNTAGPWQSLGAWLLGGGLSLAGALCYAELATTYRRSGGDYVYLTEAYGRWAGFLFAWAQLVAVWTASVGTMAYAFGDYGVQLFGLEPLATVWLAAAAVMTVAAVNALGVAAGKWTQNILTAVKVAGLVGVVLAGIACAIIQNEATLLQASRGVPGTGSSGAFGLALVFVLYAYGGWNDAAFVAAEVRHPRRNLPLALLGGVGAVTLIYLAVNAAYLAALGFDGARQSSTPASDAVAAAIGPIGARLVSVLVMISALGAMNGMIFAGARVFAVFGADFRLFAWLNRRSSATGAPVAAIAAQAVVTLAMIFAVGTPAGQRTIDRTFTAVGAPAVPWATYFGGFETLLAATAPVFWTLFFAVGVALIVLRWRHPDRERPFSVPLYPLPPLVFCATCLFMLYSSLDYAKWLTLLGAAPVAAGMLIYFVAHRRKADA
jgi:basic amino acid/polyamine antiporter, APA family